MHKQISVDKFIPVEEFLASDASKDMHTGSLRQLTPGVVDSAQEIMTGFGLYLLEKGYDEGLAEKYANPHATLQRLRSTDTSSFVLDGSEIIGLPIDYFRDTTGEEYHKSNEAAKASYSQREAKLLDLTNKLARLVIDNPADTDRDLRQRVVDMLNSYATHDDGMKEVVNGAYFSSLNRNTLNKRGAEYWLGRLLLAWDQAHYPEVDHAIVDTDDRLFESRKTTIADKYLEEALRTQALNLNGLDKYLAISQVLYAGDMRKAFMNISAVAKMTNQPMPEGWQAFQGNTAEFAKIEAVLAKAEAGVDGYLKMANEVFDGDMKKAFKNISAVAKMTNQPMPEGWQAFQGNTAEFAKIEAVLTKAEAGVDGYLKMANEVFAGDMKKAFKNISAVAKMTDQPMPEGWQTFQGSTAEFAKQQEWLIANPKHTPESFRARFYPANKFVGTSLKNYATLVRYLSPN